MAIWDLWELKSSSLGWVRVRRRDDFAHCEISKCARLIFSEFLGIARDWLSVPKRPTF